MYTLIYGACLEFTGALHPQSVSVDIQWGRPPIVPSIAPTSWHTFRSSSAKRTLISTQRPLPILGISDITKVTGSIIACPLFGVLRREKWNEHYALRMESTFRWLRNRRYIAEIDGWQACWPDCPPASTDWSDWMESLGCSNVITT